MVTDLIVFNMLDFDIILGVNLLSQYKVNIDYKKNKVWFHLDDSEKLTFGKGRVLSIMINSVKIRKMLSKGCTSY